MPHRRILRACQLFLCLSCSYTYIADRSGQTFVTCPGLRVQGWAEIGAASDCLEKEGCCCEGCASDCASRPPDRGISEACWGHVADQVDAVGVRPAAKQAAEAAGQETSTSARPLVQAWIV